MKLCWCVIMCLGSCFYFKAKDPIYFITVRFFLIKTLFLSLGLILSVIKGSHALKINFITLFQNKPKVNNILWYVFRKKRTFVALFHFYH